MNLFAWESTTQADHFTAARPLQLEAFLGQVCAACNGFVPASQAGRLSFRYLIPPLKPMA